MSPAWAADPVVAQFWYSFGGKNREVTEAHIKRFNESQSKYRIEGTFQGDYFQALAKIRAAAATKTAPAAFHVIGEAIPQLGRPGCFENLEPYAKGAERRQPRGLPARADPARYFDYLGKPAAPLVALPFFRSTPILYYNADMLAAKGVKVPATWDELRDAAAKLTVREGSETKVYGFEVPVDWWFWYALLHEAGGSLRHARRQEGRLPREGRGGAPVLGGPRQQGQDHEAARRARTTTPGRSPTPTSSTSAWR